VSLTGVGAVTTEVSAKVKSLPLTVAEVPKKRVGTGADEEVTGIILLANMFFFTKKYIVTYMG